MRKTKNQGWMDDSMEQDKINRKEKKRSGKGRFVIGFVAGLVVMGAACFVTTKVLPSMLYGTSVVGGTSVLTSDTTQKIDLITDMIKNNYYEEVDDEVLETGLYRGLFDGLDEYSQYFTEEEYNDLYESTVTGTYSGIGATLQQDQENMQVTIVKISEGSPAQEAGLQVGDIIISADEYNSVDMSLSDFVTHVKGEEGTAVHLVIYRDGKECEFDIERRNLVYPSVDHQMLQDNIGYIQISEFSDSTTEQFESAMQDLTEQGMTSLIVDLRSNPGGLVTSVTEILDQLLPAGLLVYTEDINGEKETYNSTDATSVDMPIAVLVNEYSASASEIFAGAMQDRAYGTIIGTTTYGKGVVQSILPLSDGSAIKVTTSRYFTPNGVCIQGIGITPDVELEYEFLGGEDDEYSVDLDNQILKAVEVLESK